MKIFVDTGKIEDIKKANDLGVICGVTTNPSLIAKEGGRSQEEILKEIASIRWTNLQILIVNIKQEETTVVPKLNVLKLLTLFA